EGLSPKPGSSGPVVCCRAIDFHARSFREGSARTHPPCPPASRSRTLRDSPRSCTKRRLDRSRRRVPPTSSSATDLPSPSTGAPGRFACRCSDRAGADTPPERANGHNPPGSGRRRTGRGATLAASLEALAKQLLRRLGTLHTGERRLGDALADTLFHHEDRKSTRLNSSHVKISYA